MPVIIDALARLLRPEQSVIVRLLSEQPVTVNDVLAVPRLDTACEAEPGCCDEWPRSSG